MTEVTITHLGHLGDGVAEGPIYAARTLPGERVSGVRDGDRMLNPKIVTPSEARVTPPCQHFKACGGCAMQHARDDLVASWKTEIVAHALAQVGVRTQIRPIVTSPRESRRRVKLAARRTKSGAIAGFRGRASHEIVDIRGCVLTTPALARGPELARELALRGASRKDALAVHITETADGLDVVVSGGKPHDATLQQDLAALLTPFSIARLIWEDELAAQTCEPRNMIGGAYVSPPPGSFLQATGHGEHVLQACVAESVGAATPILDLFAGCGTFTLPLARTRPVHAVEEDQPMIQALQAGADHGRLGFPVTSETRDLFRNPLPADELSRFGAVVIDPPRAGALAQTEQLAKAQVPQIAYVSCDPRSFARDVALLCSEGYCLEWVQPVDQFRWSAHVELAASLKLAHMTDAADETTG